MQNNIIKAADLLRQAWDNNEAGNPIRDLVDSTDLDTAYMIQNYNDRLWQARGRRRVGRKLGLTNKAVQQQFGISDPCYGTIYADMVLIDGAEITKPVVSDQRVETEIAVVLKKDLTQTAHTILDIIDAVDYLLPAFEICDSRVTGWDVTSCDFVADNAAACLVVLGTRPVYLADCDITRSEMVTRRGDEVVSQGKATAILGHPLHALKWLADDLVRTGNPLRAGEFVITGAIGPAVSAKPGDAFDAEITGLGLISTRFAG
ncbi:fumarylacetoacetate hydrolase family protein [Yokenella regensburgei]|uniref:2-keto-4-pentenoate hydratase n=1 Tax=Yokenella regensburgei TaxID=158877 RepID=UPI003F141133